MANRDTLTADIDQFIEDYGMLPQGGVPPIALTMSSVNEDLPLDMKFTIGDFEFAAQYLFTTYPQYTYDVWYAGLTEYLAGRINTNPPAPPGTVPASIFSKPLLIFGGVMLAVYLLTRKGKSEII
jgi:hypothetical protein